MRGGRVSDEEKGGWIGEGGGRRGCQASKGVGGGQKIVDVYLAELGNTGHEVGVHWMLAEATIIVKDYTR